MRSLFRLAAPAVALAFASAPVAGQTPASTSADADALGGDASARVKRSVKPWRISPAAIDFSSQYIDNVFLLKNSRRDNLAAPAAEDALSGRYADMHSASDMVMTLEAGLRIKGPGAFGRTLAITPELEYEYYAANARRRNATLRIELEQSLARGGELRVRGRLAPSYFAKNYLADATDADASGTIELNERVYRPGTYREIDLSVDYRHRLSKSTKHSPFGAALRVGGGYYSRAYEEPFGGRDLSGPAVQLALLTRLTRRFRLDIDCGLAALSATPTDEVLLIDEPAVGQDLNGNGSTSDLKVRSVQRVDRSRLENRVGAAMRLEFNRITDLELGYERRWRAYRSDQPLDVAYNGRSAGRDHVTGEVSLRIARGVHLGIGGAVAAQYLSRGSDFGGTGEIGDYTKRSFSAKLGYRF